MSILVLSNETLCKYNVESSGGVYGLFDGRINAVVKDNAACNRVIRSSDLFKD